MTLYKHAKALQDLVEIDMPRIEKGFTPEECENEVFVVLRWGRNDRIDPIGKWSGWSKVFGSIARLRESGCEKFKNMRRSAIDAGVFEITGAIN